MSTSIASVDLLHRLHHQFCAAVSSERLPELTSSVSMPASLTRETLWNIFDAQVISRQIDFMARHLKQTNRSFYTISSAGHEGNAAIAAVFRPSDMAFLHYRSGGFVMQRAQQAGLETMVRDTLLSIMAAEADPLAQGRHKVWGSVALSIPPQTSTIASHLPKAVGAACSIMRAKSLRIDHPLPDDSVILCSFGDASANHATALSAFNTSQWLAKAGYPLPLVFVCEDNGLGISVSTPADWIAQRFQSAPNLVYIAVDGLNVFDVWQGATRAERIARVDKQPVFLHMKCVRLLGHAGSDHELHYRSAEAIDRDEANDPLLHTAQLLIHVGVTAEAILARHQHHVKNVQQQTEAIGEASQLSSAEAVMASVVPPKRAVSVPDSPTEEQRQAVMGAQYQKSSQALTLAQQLNMALSDLLLQYPSIILFGEDIAKKGGVYRVTADLQARFGRMRVFDTVLDETTILGQAIGHAHNGFLPIPEIQFLAYLHNAEDQLRGEAATLSFFSSGQFTNPMVIRVASFAYQRGFGGHFHNDNSIAVLRDLPGVIVASPSHGPDAVKLLRECVRLAYQEQRVVVFLEPIALYHQKDLYAPGDQQWLFPYPDPLDTIRYGEVGVVGYASKTVIISYANGYYLACQAAQRLHEQENIDVKVIDLRWLAPLPWVSLLSALSDCEQLLVVDEGRDSGSLSEGLVTGLLERMPKSPRWARVTAEDSYISLGDSWQYLLPDQEKIVAAVKQLHKG